MEEFIIEAIPPAAFWSNKFFIGVFSNFRILGQKV